MQTTTKEYKQFIKRKIKNLVEDVIIRCQLISGDITQLQKQKVEKFEKMLLEFINQNKQ